jgi:hypothetical protein
MWALAEQCFRQYSPGSLGKPENVSVRELNHRVTGASHHEEYWSAENELEFSSAYRAWEACILSHASEQTVSEASQTDPGEGCSS